MSHIDILSDFRRDGTMGLFLGLFWCAAVAGSVLGHHSRFGQFNSRLGANKFPFSRQRELAGKALIWLVIFGRKAHFRGTIEKVPGFTGKTGNFARRRKPRICDGADPSRAAGCRFAARAATVMSERARALPLRGGKCHATARLRPVSGIALPQASA